MQYLVVSKPVPADVIAGLDVIADGEMVAFEGPWTFGAPVVARLDDAANLSSLKAKFTAAGLNAFAVEGVSEVGASQAILVGAHMMRDPEGFRPYAAAVPDTVKKYGGKFIARGGKVTPLAGSFVPERVVLTEYATADGAVAWYTSVDYAPLLKTRLATTEARLVVLVRSGDWPSVARAKAAAYLSGQR